MKQKNKQNILKLTRAFVLCSALFIILFSFGNVYAQSSCNPNNDSPGSCMAFGGTPNPDGTCSCPGVRTPGVSGSACSVSNPCGQGLTCSSQTSICILEDAGPTPTVNPSIPGDVPPGSGLPGNVVAGGCPSGLTRDPSSGLCLPPQQFTKGIAASSDLMTLIFSVIKLLLLFAGVVAVFILVIGGYLYMSSGGNEEQAEKGKKTVTNFALGLFIIIMAYAIVTIIGNTLTDNKFVSTSNNAPSITNTNSSGQ